MTPSEAHESAWKREPEHDQMVLEVLMAARKQWPILHLDFPDTGEPVDASLGWSGAEVLFGGDRGPRWFADIALRYDRPARDTLLREQWHWRILEVKPRIYSAGALVRQVKVQDQNATNLYRLHPGRELTTEVVPVVRNGDPLAQMVADLLEAPIITWGSRGFALLRPQHP